MKTIDQILKIKAVVLYILKAFPEGVDYIHLFKVMYFAQQNQLKEYGLPIIYDTFVAIYKWYKESANRIRSSLLGLPRW